MAAENTHKPFWIFHLTIIYEQFTVHELCVYCIPLFAIHIHTDICIHSISNMSESEPFFPQKQALSLIWVTPLQKRMAFLLLCDNIVSCKGTVASFLDINNLNAHKLCVTNFQPLQRTPYATVLAFMPKSGSKRRWEGWLKSFFILTFGGNICWLISVYYS